MANKIIDRHLNLQDEQELIDYICDMFAANHKKDYVDISTLDEPELLDGLDDMISGHINNMYFEINFVPQRYMILRTSDAYSEEEKKLIRILNPVMWNIHEDSVAPSVAHVGETDVIFTAPIYDVIFTDLNLHETVWDIYDPEDSISELAFEYYVLHEKMANLNIHHPKYKIEDFYDKLKVGLYPAGFDKDFIDSLPARTEFEIYLMISARRKIIMDYYDSKTYIEDEDTQNSIVEEVYQVQYLFQQVGKLFGVKVNPPSHDVVEPTPDLIAWEQWWKNGVSEAIMDQQTFEKVTMGKYGYDPCFRPSGSYKDLLPEVEKILKKKKANQEDGQEVEMDN